MMNSNNTTKTIYERFKSLLTSLPFLFTISLLIISISFFFSSFPIGRTPVVEETIQRVYFADNIAFGHRELIKKFNELHKGEIEVVPIDLPFTKFNTNQRKELIARNLRSRSSRIDIFSVDLVWVPRFTKWAEPLSPYFPTKLLSELVPQSLETCYVDGQLYAMPIYLDIGALYYREDMILSLPDGEAINKKIKKSISWKDLLAITAEHFPDRPAYMLQGEAYEGLVCNFNEIIGQPLLKPNSREMIDLTDSLIVERVQFMRQLIESGVSPVAVLNMTEDECIDYALKNDVPFVRGWPTVDNEGEVLYDPVKFSKLALAPLPHFEGYESSPVFGGWNMMLSKHSPVKEASILFMQFVASLEGQTIFYEAEGLLPIQKKFYHSESDEERQQRLTKVAKMFEKGIHRPAISDYTLISDILSHQIHSILAGEIAVVDGLQEAKNRISMIESIRN